MVYVDHGSHDQDDSTIRCQCLFYLFNGICKHATHVLELEERYAALNPQVYALELRRKFDHPRPTPGTYPGG